MNSPQTIKVWDIFIRIFHWGLALSFLIAYITEDDFMFLHTNAGYSILGLISLRILWGFVGSQHARFKDFVYPFYVIKEFIKNTFIGKSKRYIGHNPAGGLMIFLILISLATTSVTGIILEGTEGSGPFGAQLSNSNEMVEDILEEIHEFFANFSLLLIFLHIAGVLVESFIHKENLTKAMITGFKKK